MQLQEEITQIRRTIHRHPEIGRKEFRTSKLIREKLAELGVDEIQSPVPTAVIGLIHGGKGLGKFLIGGIAHGGKGRYHGIPLDRKGG